MPTRYGLALLLLGHLRRRLPRRRRLRAQPRRQPPRRGRPPPLQTSYSAPPATAAKPHCPPRTAPDLTTVTHRASSAWVQEFLTDHHNAGPVPLHPLPGLTHPPPQNPPAQRATSTPSAAATSTTPPAAPPATPHNPTSNRPTRQPPPSPIPTSPSPTSPPNTPSPASPPSSPTPLTTRPDGRMPHFPMLPRTPSDLSRLPPRFPRKRRHPRPNNSPPLKPDPTLAATGHALAASQNCAACHTLPNLKPKPTHPYHQQRRRLPHQQSLRPDPIHKKASLQLYLNNPSHSPHHRPGPRRPQLRRPATTPAPPAPPLLYRRSKPRRYRPLPPTPH